MKAQVKRKENAPPWVILSPRDMDDFDAVSIGLRIREARKASGMTQQQLAKKAGVSRRALQYYEAGKIIPFPHAAAIAEATGRSSAWILYGEDPALEAVREALELIRRRSQP